jgi:hypothetical protein
MLIASKQATNQPTNKRKNTECLFGKRQASEIRENNTRKTSTPIAADAKNKDNAAYMDLRRQRVPVGTISSSLTCCPFTLFVGGQ